MSIDSEWKEILRPWTRTERYKELSQVLKSEPAYPVQGTRLRAFEVTPYKSVRVVVLGQDPYPTPNVATGLAFEVNPNLKKKEWPATAKNIQRELLDDVNSDKPFGLFHAQQGVLLLNTFLTTAPGKPMSHSFIWDGFIDFVIKALVEKENIVWLAWGQAAQGTLSRVRKYNKTHVVLPSPHPSPLAGLSGGPTFLGSKPFTRCNDTLESLDQAPINW